MHNIKDISFEPLVQSNYVKPLRMLYTQNGIRKAWDLLRIHDSVAVLLFNTTRKVFVFVRQFRPAVYFDDIADSDVNSPVDTDKYPVEKGFTIELCAGIVDKQKSLEEIAKDELLEECGYEVPLSVLHKISTHRSGIGVTGDRQTLFYAEVTDDMRKGPGGGIIEEGEFIEVIEMTVDEVKQYLASGDVRSPGGFMFALTWYLHNRLPASHKKDAV
ncbi:uridine diphosphate glucose pyrophosphatase NUDT14-like [Schistocerca americana]|uniref:uridine diphosphate glucose pyrophosphatase NUDT14-like n=1 Tax=Schistocerca americana TaxID=7009 RepID=UPI001F4F5694|nr:uridine diphosphate glucose pyrophosphatase NUDT14-like [Schistocerca americana]XP_049956336.1 uridine diphosphate glucose pyrophosphatase NUDT14-like [Schistocerca serialis cubense]